MSLVWLIFLAVGVAVAIVDATAYRIPNYGLVALFVLFAVVAAVRGSEISWLEHFGAGALGLGAGVALFALGQVGAGDAKLFATLSLWSGFKAIIPLFFFVALAGLIQVIVIVVLRRLAPKVQSMLPPLRSATLPRILVKREGIPFGVGMVGGALIAAQWFPDWLWVGHLAM